MSAIIIQPNTRSSRVVAAPEDFMPLSTRILVADRINTLWAQYVGETEGPTVGPAVAKAFWDFVRRAG